jgi:TolB-like protein/tRNA A-37 threonylcarbamoyl transferase component Bud32
MADSLRDRLQTALGTGYALESELRGGGMSRVFLATETALGRRVVIKVLPAELAAEVSLERFKREILLAARLQHPHIVPLLAAGEIGGLPYFTMPFVEGESLRVRLARHGELPVAEAVRVLREIASALAYAHEHGVVHRDIKPDNVLLSGGAAMVTDFGVAKAISSSSNVEHGGVTSLGVALGTPAYMSPEQASADPAVDHRADVYAFGVLAYELLSGQTPFGGRTPQGLLAAHVTEVPEPVQKRRPALPPGLAALVMRCLEKRPADRPQSAAEIVHALDDLSTPSGGTSPTSTVPLRAGVGTSGKTTRRVPSRALVAIGVALALALVAGSVFALRRGGASVSAADTRPRSIAVLPLQNVGGDTANQFFADGMTDELTSTMAKLPGLHVASRSATAAALKAGGDVKSTGQRLAVGAVLEGRIRRVGDRMRLTAQLTNVSDGLILWTESYDREVKDAFQVQDEVARSIAGALQVTLAGAPRDLADRATTSPAAHDLYLRGRYVQAKYTEADIRKSLELFQGALAKDPTYAAAWAGIADSWNMLADDFMAPREAAPKVREAIARGMSIDSAAPELRYVRGITAYYYDGDAHSAERMMGEALRASPRLQWGTSIYPAVLWTVGKRDSAAAFLRHAIERDPTAPEVLENASAYFVATGDLTTARMYCDRLEELHEGERCSARLDVEAGRTEQAIELYRRSMTDPSPIMSLGARQEMVGALVKANRLAEARAIATQVDAEARSGGARRYLREDVIALMWARIGDYDRAMYWYERALRSGSAGIGGLYFNLAKEPIRHDPRILAFAKRAGLPDPPPYWR